MILTARELSEELGLPLAAVRRKLADVPRSGTGYAVGAAARLLLAGDPLAELSPAQRCSWLRSEITRIELSAESGEDLPAEQFRAALADCFKAIAHRLEVTTDLLEAEAGLRDLAPAQEVIDQHRRTLAGRIAGGQ